jgi:hypothetical protein
MQKPMAYERPESRPDTIIHGWAVYRIFIIVSEIDVKRQYLVLSFLLNMAISFE